MSSMSRIMNLRFVPNLLSRVTDWANFRVFFGNHRSTYVSLKIGLVFITVKVSYLPWRPGLVVSSPHGTKEILPMGITFKNQLLSLTKYGLGYILATLLLSSNF
jgi:hypothetical protein